MLKKHLLLMVMFIAGSMLILPAAGMAALTIYENFDADQHVVELTVSQDTNDIAGFAVGFGSLNMYDGTWIDNSYSSSWQSFKVRRNGDGDWVKWTPAGDDTMVEWLEGWGNSYDYAHVFADPMMGAWYQYDNGTYPPEEGIPDPMTCLTGSPIDGWFGSVDLPYSPFYTIRVNESGGPAPSLVFIEGETVAAVPIPGAVILLGSGLALLFGLRRGSKQEMHA